MVVVYVFLWGVEGAACSENSHPPIWLHRDLQNYMVWRFVMSMVMSLSGSYRETRKEYRKVRRPDPDVNLSADQHGIQLTRRSSV